MLWSTTLGERNKGEKRIFIAIVVAPVRSNEGLKQAGSRKSRKSYPIVTCVEIGEVIRFLYDLNRERKLKKKTFKSNLSFFSLTH